jgi:hypothetical protein
LATSCSENIRAQDVRPKVTLAKFFPIVSEEWLFAFFLLRFVLKILYSASLPWIFNNKKPQDNPNKIKVIQRIAPLKSILSAVIRSLPEVLIKIIILGME